MVLANVINLVDVGAVSGVGVAARLVLSDESVGGVDGRMEVL